MHHYLCIAIQRLKSAFKMLVLYKYIVKNKRFNILQCKTMRYGFLKCCTIKPCLFTATSRHFHNVPGILYYLYN